MALDTLDTLVGMVQQRVGPSPDYFLVVSSIVNAGRAIFRERDWTFRRRSAQFVFNVAYTTGTVSIVRGESWADFSGATLTQAMVGRQLRIAGNSTAILTITRVDGSRAYLSDVWGSIGQTATTYEIYNAYVTAPSDFDSFVSVVDLDRNFQLDWWTLTAADIDRYDPQRSYGGNLAYAIVLRDYATIGQGVVGTLIQARGTGSVPAAGGQYTGVADTVVTVEMTSATQFKWRKDSGTYVTGVTIDSEGVQQELVDGVSVAFPTTGTYVSGDIFVIPASAARNAGDPRFEPWPHIKADENRPYLYLARPIDLGDPGATLPRGIPGDLVLERALEIMYLAIAGNPQNVKVANTYLKLADIHAGRYANLLEDVVREDEAKESTILTYDGWSNLPVYDSGYLAGHDVGYEVDVL